MEQPRKSFSRTVIGLVTAVTAITGLFVVLVKLRHECGNRDFVACASYVWSGFPQSTPPISRPPAGVPAGQRQTERDPDRVPPGVLLPSKPDKICVFLGGKMTCEDPKPR